MISGNVLKLFSRRYLRKSLLSSVHEKWLSTKGNGCELFFAANVQDLLWKMTRVDIEKVFSPRKEGVDRQPPEYKFMTTQQYQKVKTEAEDRVKEKLQMPPVLPERREIDQVLVKDTNLEGFTKSKFVFTDITIGQNDRERVIVVRDEEGILREAHWSERDRMNQIYFPQPSRKLIPAKMFQPHNLKRLLESGEYIFVLDSACCQFEPDDPIYISVCQQTYTAIDGESAYNCLRSTRHFGPMVFYLVQNKMIDNLLSEYIATDSLEEAVCLISLHHILHPDSVSANTSHSEGKELDYIQAYIDGDSLNKDKLQLMLQTYREYLSSHKSQHLESTSPSLST